MGTDAGLAAPAEGVARSGTVVGPAGIGIGVGVDVGRLIEVGRSNDAAVNAIGGSKRAKAVCPQESPNTPVHRAAHIGSRENMFIGGTTSGSHGGPTVVITVPSADVLLPKPNLGQARS